MFMSIKIADRDATLMQCMEQRCMHAKISPEDKPFLILLLAKSNPGYVLSLFVYDAKVSGEIRILGERLQIDCQIYQEKSTNLEFGAGYMRTGM